jgi:hypothetical protein
VNHILRDALKLFGRKLLNYLEGCFKNSHFKQFLSIHDAMRCFEKIQLLEDLENQ